MSLSAPFSSPWAPASFLNYNKQENWGLTLLPSGLLQSSEKVFPLHYVHALFYFYVFFSVFCSICQEPGSLTPERCPDPPSPNHCNIVTKYWKLGGLRDLLWSVLDVRSPKSGCQQGHAPSETRQTPSLLFSLLLVEAVVLGFPQLAAASVLSLSSSSLAGFTLYFSWDHLCLCPNFLFW
jgi:hypothetical protein